MALVFFFVFFDAHGTATIGEGSVVLGLFAF